MQQSGREGKEETVMFARRSTADTNEKNTSPENCSKRVTNSLPDGVKFVVVFGVAARGR